MQLTFSAQVLDQTASILEHGWKVYSQNLWSFLDTTFILIFMAYLVVRMHALRLTDEQQTIILSRTALDILSCRAPILVPRLAFNIMSENMLFVSLRAMMSDFLTLTLLAVWCFAGFLLSMKWLHDGAHSVRDSWCPERRRAYTFSSRLPSRSGWSGYGSGVMAPGYRDLQTFTGCFGQL